MPSLGRQMPVSTRVVIVHNAALRRRNRFWTDMNDATGTGCGMLQAARNEFDQAWKAAAAYMVPSAFPPVIEAKTMLVNARPVLFVCSLLQFHCLGPTVVLKTNCSLNLPKPGFCFQVPNTLPDLRDSGRYTSDVVRS
jgi:hypothetical protein